MLFWLIISAIFCSSTIQAAPFASYFYPKNINVASCKGAFSWTKLFNSAKPSDHPDNIDIESLEVIRQSNPLDVCPRPIAMEAQRLDKYDFSDEIPGLWIMTNRFVSGFQSGLGKNIDFQVRFCCPNTDFTPTAQTTTTTAITTTTAATTIRPISSSTCGRAEIKHSLNASRISGGSAAIPNSWPWQVFYEERRPCGNGAICLAACGGTIIDSRHILTAAHCVGAIDPILITITAGLHNRMINEPEARQMRSVERFFKHPDYNPQTIEDDIAVIRLAQPLQYNRYVQPACLPGPDPPQDTSVVLTGWGATEMGGSGYHELKQATVRVIGRCNQYWPRVKEEKQICVANYSSGESACQGDSGGPMSFEHNGQWIVSGVTSFGPQTQCSTWAYNPPNVYTRVSFYLPWILSII